jgi:hypothetical protein
MSFRLSFHLPPLGPTGAHWLDDLPDPTCKDSTRQHSVDDPLRVPRQLQKPQLSVIRKRSSGVQVQVYAGRDPLTGRKHWISRQVPWQTKAAWRQAQKVEAELLEQVDRGEQRGSRTRTIGELVERWFTWQGGR